MDWFTHNMFPIHIIINLICTIPIARKTVLPNILSCALVCVRKMCIEKESKAIQDKETDRGWARVLMCLIRAHITSRAFSNLFFHNIYYHVSSLVLS